MVEPILNVMLLAASKGVAMKAIDVAVAGATQAFQRAKDHNEDDVGYMLEYFEAARLAIWGLAQEREGILGDAMICELHEDECDALEARLNEYLNQNKARPILETAINKLRSCQNLLQERHDKTWKWPWKVDDDQARQAVLDDVSELVSALVRFLDGLGDRLKYLDDSGIGAKQLVDVRKALQSRHIDRAKAAADLASTVNGARSDGSNREWLDLTIRMEATALTLRSAFR